MKPLVELAAFQLLDLRVGTVTELRRLGTMDLAAAGVEAGEPVTVLVPGSAAAQLAAGTRVVVATALHPLVAEGTTFTAFVVAVLEEGLEAADGSRLE